MHTILVIEDEPETLDNIRLMLEMENYSVLTAFTGTDGLRIALKECPDLILCDVMLPGLDGHRILEAIRANPPANTTPFIFLTARGERQDLRIGMNLGADDYLMKPVHGDEVLKAIQVRLERLSNFRQFTVGNPDFRSPEPLQRRFTLTPREAEVLLWIAQGKSNAEIATILGNAERTVKLHVTHIFDKLGVDNRHAAAMCAINVLAEDRRDEG